MSEPRQIITDKVVLAKTGSTMEDWFRHLDALGAQKLNSTQIYELINSTKGLIALGEWNRGLLSTSYQWSRGLRKRGEKSDGFEISVSKTIKVPLSVLYEALVDPDSRERWLDQRIEVTKATPNRSIRAIWSDDTTRLSIDFYSKADSKSQVVVQHLKIADATTAEVLRAMWSDRLSRLKSSLEE